MNGYKIQKCFRKEKRVSGELHCPATGLIPIFSDPTLVVSLSGTKQKFRAHAFYDLCQTLNFNLCKTFNFYAHFSAERWEYKLKVNHFYKFSKLCLYM